MTVRPLALAPWALGLGLALPIAAGLAGTLAPALTGGGFQSLVDWPGLPRAMALSLGTGLVSTILSLAITALLIGCLHDTRGFSMLRRALSPLLSLPHAAAALGLAFLIAPSGWIARALSPWATGWTDPPDLLILNDPMGLALTAGLVTKEVPFLLLIALSVLPQTDAPRRAEIAAGLGYGRAMGFALATFPALYRSLRLPVFAVLAYGMTNVDMALILGPSLPPPLAVQVADWMADPRLARLPTAAAGAVVQLALVVAAIALWLGAERLAAPLVPGLALRGWRGRVLDAPMAALARASGLTIALGLGAGMAGLTLWSFAGLWPFPAALPDSLTLKTWAKAAPDLTATSLTTLAIALAASLAALALTLATLEAETRRGRPLRLEGLIYLPLILPQIAFLPGLQVLALVLGAKGSAATVAAAHLVFVLPYVWLSLAPAFRAWDDRIGLTAAAMGASPGRIFWRLRLPMLLAPLLTALAVGIAVSVGQYLPSLMLGGGRVETLTTEAVALASGGNRRLIGAVALMQMALPALGFGLAVALPRLAFANRRALLAERRAP
ncbi:ABC transporter permease subunit [Rhodobacteraceae bacterium KMS-5]|uniref:ABC transporter permease subunit n=1 Tax=Tabrizicola oligotrophica TaxID=2710650 RepID=A0A6M0QMK6_9RHOB|nr:ABC transporter permease subunit [Tabrizicola oligotrophica]